jgi:hypothetical protein
VSFKKFIDKKTFETVSASDISAVDNKLDLVKRHYNHSKGKRCKKHKLFDCEICENEKWEKS